MKRRLGDASPASNDQSDPNKLQDRRFARRRENTTVLVSNLPKSYNYSKVKKYFEDCGTIAQIDICDSLSKTTRLARVEFTSYNDVLSALTKTFKKIGNNQIEVKTLDECTLWMTNFPPTYTNKDIKQLLQSIGVLALSVRFPSLRFNSNRRFAYVDVPSQIDLEKAILELNGKELEKYSLVVRKSNVMERSKRTDSGVLEKREIMVRDMDVQKITEDILMKFFSRFGSIESIKISSTMNTGRNGGYAFVVFKEKASAEAAIAAGDSLINQQKVTITLADRKGYLERQIVKRILYQRDKNDSIISLYPLDDKVSKAHVELLLVEKTNIKHNEIKNTYLVTDLQGALIVLKESKLAAKCVMSLNGIQYRGKTLRCGSVSELKKYTYKKTPTDSLCLRTKFQQNVGKVQSSDVTEVPKLSNDDFRKLFLGE